MKQSDEAEVHIYRDFLEGQGLPAPAYFGCAREAGKLWILPEYVEGTDLRDYTDEMADACARSLSRIANRYWQEGFTVQAHLRNEDKTEVWKESGNRNAKNSPFQDDRRDRCFFERQSREK